MDECPHGGDPYSCPPCRRGNHVVAKEAGRMTTNKGRTKTVMASSVCPNSPPDSIHLLRRGDTAIYDGARWICEGCA